ERAHHGGDRLLGGHVDGVAGDGGGQGVEALQVEPVHLRPLRGEALADRQPDPPCGTGDGDAPPREPVGHGPFPLTAGCSSTSRPAAAGARIGEAAPLRRAAPVVELQRSPLLPEGDALMAPESDVLAAVEALAVVPVVEIDDAAAAVPLARTLAEAGLPVVEVTFRTPAARDAVAAIAAELPDFLLGAGTLVLPDMVTAAAEAGARFGVSPGSSSACLAAAEEAGLPFVPGAVTPSEVGA